MRHTIVFMLSLIFPALLAAGIAEGEAKSAVCVSCHNKDGNSSITQYPKIAGQHATYIEKQLKDYQNEDSGRDNAIMKGMVQTLSEQDIKDLASYFSAQTISDGSADANLVALGESIYRGGILEKGVPACSGCHGPAGLGNSPAKFPRLSGQHADYTVEQLKLFKSAKRRNDINGMMRTIAMNMTEEEMKAVASFIQGLHQ